MVTWALRRRFPLPSALLVSSRTWQRFHRDVILPHAIQLASPAMPATRRHVHVDPILLPPVIFLGLLAALWTWKCLMMVAFQNKIIFMPGMPPNARRERIDDYAALCGGVQWREKRICAADGTDLALCVASVATLPTTGNGSKSGVGMVAGLDDVVEAPVYILYFQGPPPT
jgi:uncharacterized protein